MLDPITIGLGLASAGGGLLSGMGASQASAKQGRLQQIQDNEARRLNNEQLWGVGMVNDQRNALGRELLTVKETTDIEQWDDSTSGSWVDIDGMMAAAERAGFNPVTFLNAGGMQAYTQGWSKSYQRSKTTREGHNAADAFKMMIPEYALASASQVPQQHSMLSALGGALTAGANTLGTQYRANQSYDAQMARVLAAGASRGMGLTDGNGYAGTYASPGSAGSGVIPGLAGGGSTGKGDAYWPAYELPPSQLWEVKKPESTNPLPPSWGWSIPPGYANAESWEDTFGEPVSWPYGIVKFGDTVLYNTTGKTAAGHFQQAKDDIAAWRATPLPWNATRYSGTPYSTGSMSP